MFRRFWPIFLVMLLGGCGWNGSPTRINEFTPLTSLEIVASSSTIAAGTSTRLTVKGNFSGIFTRDITDQVTWSSDTPGVVEFITAGQPNRVSGHIPGTAVITATVGKVSSTFTLTVSNATITNLTLSPAAPSLAKGRGTGFQANGTFSDGSHQDLTFDAAWSSSDPTVASISDTGDTKGVVATQAVGTTTITASFDGASQSTLLTVTQPVLDSITVTTTQPSLLSLSSTTFTATGTLSDGSTTDLTAQASWSSSQTSIATVAPNGAVTALDQGSTTISATFNGLSGASSLKVTGGKLTGITITPTNPIMVKGTILPITATGTFSNGRTRDITSHVTWNVDNANASVSQQQGSSLALLNAVTETTTAIPIKATVNSVNGTTNLTVNNLSVTSLALLPTTLTLAEDTVGRLKATATLSNGSTQDVTFSAEWSATGTAGVGNTAADRSKGRVTGNGSGAATITASYGGQSATASINVPFPPRQFRSLTITPASPTISIGSTTQFTATVTYTDNTTQDVTEDVEWSIDDPAIAILADNSNLPGQVAGVDTGTVQLKATFNTNQTQTVPVTVGL